MLYEVITRIQPFEYGTVHQGYAYFDASDGGLRGAYHLGCRFDHHLE